MPKDTNATNTETGTPGASESSMPPTAATSAKTMVSAMDRPGLEMTVAAAAAGVRVDATRLAATRR